MGQKRKREKYPKEFIEGAVQMVAAGKSAAQVAEELGLPGWKVQGWVRSSNSPSKSPTEEDLAQENKRLKKELARLQEETEILKKAAAYFARHQQ